MGLIMHHDFQMQKKKKITLFSFTKIKLSQIFQGTNILGNCISCMHWGPKLYASQQTH